MDIETFRQIALARHLYELGKSNLSSTVDLHLFASVNLIQDAVEAFLIAVANHTNAGIESNTTFDRYFQLINAKIFPKELPFKLKLLRLNRIRVDSKHYGIQPARDECIRLAVSVREFFDEVSASIFNVSFSTISAIELLDPGEARDFLTIAKSALEKGDLEACAVSCRKALYLEIEKDYDVSEFAEKTEFFGPYSSAPSYAKSKEYIDQSVRDPTDFIVRDHSKINEELLTKRVDATAFWNMWRLTPEVYKRKLDGKWFVKREFDKIDNNVLSDKIEYIFSTAVDIVMGVHANRRASKWAHQGQYELPLVGDSIPVYQKADSSSAIVGTTPAGMTSITTDFSVEGFDGESVFWHVIHAEASTFLWGYVRDADVKVE